MWDLVPQLGIEPGPPALGAWSLSHWTTREGPLPPGNTHACHPVVCFPPSSLMDLCLLCRLTRGLGLVSFLSHSALSPGHPTHGSSCSYHLYPSDSWTYSSSFFLFVELPQRHLKFIMARVDLTWSCPSVFSPKFPLLVTIHLFRKSATSEIS